MLDLFLFLLFSFLVFFILPKVVGKNKKKAMGAIQPTHSNKGCNIHAKMHSIAVPSIQTSASPRIYGSSFLFEEILLSSKLLFSSVLSTRSFDEIFVVPPADLIAEVDKKAAGIDISRNEFINQCIKFALENMANEMNTLVREHGK